MKITDEYLIEQGFHKFDRTQFQPSSVIYNFQKCYRDEEGNKKFFIDCAKWDWTWTGQRVSDTYSYSFSGQYYQKGTHDAFNIEFIGWDLVQVETFLNSMFNAGLIENYEYGD